jgi:[citrate (pro-3S)-lyase] ligase
MQTPPPIVFRCTEVNSSPQRLAAIRKLLADSHLEMDGDITTFVEARAGNRVVGCAGLAGNVIKCVAVTPQLRGENLSAQLLTEVENLALSRGHFHLFLYTRPCNRDRFEHNGFWPIVQSGNDTILMENIPSGIQRYCHTLQAYRVPGKRIGSIVMNANPFTLGHRHLVEQAAKSCDWLHLFVVREDASFFPFSTRLNMVNMGVSDLANVTVHQGSEYIISRATFPTYFLKETCKVQQAWSETDLLIFRNYIAPALGITHRFIGSEPFCDVTHQYNQTMHRVLAGTIEVVEIPRIKSTDKAISASEVRRLLKTNQFSRIREIVPDTTFACLESDYARKSQKNQEYHYENC